jgi:hypothetical protein
MVIDSVTCLSNKQLREAIKDIERGKICSEEVVFLKKSIDLLNLRLDNQQHIISVLNQKSSLQDSIINIHSKNEGINNTIISNKDKIIRIYEKKLGWNKAQKYIYAAGGFILAIILVK